MSYIAPQDLELERGSSGNSSNRSFHSTTVGRDICNFNPRQGLPRARARYQLESCESSVDESLGRLIYGREVFRRPRWSEQRLAGALTHLQHSQPPHRPF